MVVADRTAQLNYDEKKKAMGIGLKHLPSLYVFSYLLPCIGALPSGRGPTFFVLLPEYDVGSLLSPYSREHLHLASDAPTAMGILACGISCLAEALFSIHIRNGIVGPGK